MLPSQVKQTSSGFMKWTYCTHTTQNVIFLTLTTLILNLWNGVLPYKVYDFRSGRDGKGSDEF
jgi:hypothetical protein